MKNFSALILIVVLLAGCAAINRAFNAAAPNQVVNGVEIPGTHTPTPLTKDVADAIPYGSYALSFILLGVNFYQKVQSNKLSKGLSATIQAIEVASKEPAIKDAIAQLKVELSTAHQIADVQPLINRLMKKLGFPADIKPLA
ncbi:MAG: hypothetical protein WC750_05965 [Patescibacteria group bacterium]|jgi:hypothetical protein